MMSRSHQPRLSSAIAFALLCTNLSLATPVAYADHPGASVVAAYAPVHIIPAEDLPAGISFPSGGTPPTNRTSQDGTTLITDYHNGQAAHRREESGSVTGASEPVYVIPENRLPPGVIRGQSSSHTTNDGDTITTDYTPSQNLIQTGTSTVNLLTLKNQSLSLSGLDKGMNCEGSVIMCIGASQRNVMHTLRDYMYAIPKGYRYYAGQKIACMKHTVYPNPWVTWGFYCAFMQGNIPAEGEDGEEVQSKMQQMIEHGCLGCGSVPFSPDNDPNTLGIMTVNYVRQSECEGLCYYKPPGVAANADVKVPQGMTLVS